MRGIVCRKYSFVDMNTGVHTQHIENFHNEMKMEIKKRKRMRATKGINSQTNRCGNGTKYIIKPRVFFI